MPVLQKYEIFYFPIVISFLISEAFCVKIDIILKQTSI